VCADTGMLRIGGPLWWRIRHSELKNGPVMYRYGWDSSVDGWAETENICSGVGSNPVRGFFLSLMRLRVEYSIRTESVGWIFLCRRIRYWRKFHGFFRDRRAVTDTVFSGEGYRALRIQDFRRLHVDGYSFKDDGIFPVVCDRTVSDTKTA
jgi:hypothetical protein